MKPLIILLFFVIVLYSSETLVLGKEEEEKRSLNFISKMKKLDVHTEEKKKKVSIEEAVVLFKIFSDMLIYLPNKDNVKNK